MKVTIKKIVDAYSEVFHIKDTSIIPLICAITIGTKVKGDPVWLMIVGASSGGKSELINIVSKVPFVHQVSNLTENTFLSGMGPSKGKEPSLLHKIGTVGMITMKDYTSILSMRSDKKDVIIAQMREIYDGFITKKTGNNNDSSWKGKLNFIGGVTDEIYLAEESTAGMGRRAIFYSLPEADDDERIGMSKASRKNLFDIKEKREHIATITAEYIKETIENWPKEMPEISDELADEIMELANFVTIVRTPTKRDYRGVMRLAIRPEAPTRMIQQLFMIAAILEIMDGKHMDYHKKILYKISMDSIPTQKRLALRQLATFKTVTKKGVAVNLGYPTETVTEWIEDLNVMKVCHRENNHGVIGPDKWYIEERYRNIMIKYDGVEKKDDDLMDEGEYGLLSGDVDPMFAGYDDKGQRKELVAKQEARADELFESL